MMPGEELEKTVWWGAFMLDDGQAGCWHVGPSTLWVYRLPGEWRIVHVQGDDPMTAAARVTVPAAPEEAHLTLDALPPESTVSRFSFRQAGGPLSVAPVLADRPVVVRPEMPLYVPPGEATTLYVSTPLWLRFEAGEPPVLLQEVPSYRTTDTWFGPNTREGELCYASRTLGRLNLADLPFRLHRAVTPILVRNRASEALLVQRIQLPVQHLSLYQASNDFLWTQRVTLEREKDGDLAVLIAGEEPPAEAVDARLVREPRETSRTGLIGRTFSTLFHRILEG